MSANNDYTDKAMRNNVKTYEGFLTLLKAGMAVSILALLILLVIYAA